MKKLPLLLLFTLVGCATVKAPADFSYREIQTPFFTLAAWVKETSPNATFRIYIEGDGRAFTSTGKPSNNPTPTSDTLRKMAFANTSANVAYIARPCQFVTDDSCSQEDWTTGRFSPQAVTSMATAIKQIAGKREVIIYAYSGGALISGLVINNFPEIPVRKWITYAGLLNHTSWTEYKNLPPLTGSLDLTQLPELPQVHFIGDKDKVIPLELSKQWTQGHKLVILKNVGHNGPFQD